MAGQLVPRLRPHKAVTLADCPDSPGLGRMDLSLAAASGRLAPAVVEQLHEKALNVRTLVLNDWRWAYVSSMDCLRFLAHNQFVGQVSPDSQQSVVAAPSFAIRMHVGAKAQ